MAIELTKELLTTIPEEIAKTFIGNGDGNSSITSSQLRKFYNDFLVLKGKSDLVKSQEEFKAKVLPLISFSKAKIAYSYGRGNKIPKKFVESINGYVDKIETAADFENFLNFYQALIGYTTYYSKLAEDTKKEQRNNAPRVTISSKDFRR